MKPTLLLLILSLSDPNTLTDQQAFDTLVSHWLEKVVYKQVNPNSMKNRSFIKRTKNFWARVTTPEKRPVNYNEFADLARRWKKSEPNEPNLAEVHEMIGCEE